MKNFFTFWQRRSSGWRFLLGAAIAFCFALSAHALNPDLAAKLPAPAIHELPPSLVAAASTTSDYFAEITPSPLGHLIWSKFPVTVYYPAPDPAASVGEQRRQAQWQASVTQAIAEWQEYLPLVRVTVPDDADILIQRQFPPAQKQVDPDTGELRYSFARNAETSYRFYVDSEQILRHRMTILLSPHQSAIATLSTARHELGHALGIWGHSPDPKDALFFSQTSQFSLITTADINTLRKIYQQPTRLGWKMPRFNE